MPFDVVASTGTRLIALRRRQGFAVVGRPTGAFRHPALGPADAVVMLRTL